MINDPELNKDKLNDNEFKELENKTEKHNYEKLLKSLRIVGKFFKKKNESIIKKEVMMIVSEFLIGLVGLGVGLDLTISGLATVGIMFASSVSILSVISTLITNDCFSK